MRRTGYRYKRRMVWKNEASFGSLHNGNVYYISEYINFKMAFFAIKSLSIQSQC
jgi:uncharacterized protein YutD